MNGGKFTGAAVSTNNKEKIERDRERTREGGETPIAGVLPVSCMRASSEASTVTRLSLSLSLSLALSFSISLSVTVKKQRHLLNVDA